MFVQRHLKTVSLDMSGTISNHSRLAQCHVKRCSVSLGFLNPLGQNKSPGASPLGFPWKSTHASKSENCPPVSLPDLKGEGGWDAHVYFISSSGFRDCCYTHKASRLEGKLQPHPFEGTLVPLSRTGIPGLPLPDLTQDPRMVFLSPNKTPRGSMRLSCLLPPTSDPTRWFCPPEPYPFVGVFAEPGPACTLGLCSCPKLLDWESGILFDQPSSEARSGWPFLSPGVDGWVGRWSTIAEQHPGQQPW